MKDVINTQWSIEVEGKLNRNNILYSILINIKNFIKKWKNIITLLKNERGKMKPSSAKEKAETFKIKLEK